MVEYAVKTAGNEHKNEIYEIFLHSFFPDMPLFEANGVKTPFPMDDWPALQTLQDGLSLIAVTNKGEIMGYALNVVPKEGKPVGIPGPLGTFFAFIEEDSKGLLSKLEVTTMELRVMCVHKKWRGHGVAKRLVEESENLAKKLGYKSIFAMSTGAYMEAALKRHGWKCVYALYYKDYAEKNRNFKLPSEPHVRLTLYERVFGSNE